jgi:anaerobic magnesium-protoporphyrin IX monomethyl ester cyclase
MKIVFIYPAFESLAIEYLSAVAKQEGHDVCIVLDPCLFDESFLTVRPLARLFSIKENIARRVVGLKPDLVAFSVVTTDFPWFRGMAGMLRRRINAPFIAGNIHITSATEEVLRLGLLDAAVRGEGETAFADILDSLRRDRRIDPDIPNIATMRDGEMRVNPVRPLIGNLDDLPFPDKLLYDNTSVRVKEVYSVMASRGCPYNCTFCNNNLMKRLYGLKGYVRSRGVDGVIEELAMAKKTFGSRRINIYDEVFGFNRKWLEEFVGKYKREIGLPYIACANPHIVTEEYAELLRESGCVKIDLGVQTINAEKRRDIYHRTETTEQIRNSIETLKKKGVVAAAENIINFPGETEADLLEMAEFYNRTRPDILKVFWLRYFPGTEIVDIAAGKGVLTEKDVADINSGNEMGSITIGGSTAKLQKKFYFLFIISQLLPRGLVDFIIRKRLYRFFPSSAIPDVAYTFYRLAMRKNYDSEIMLHQHAGRYRYYIKRRLLPFLYK